MDNKKRFKNSSGARYTQGLFFEQVGEDKSTVVYTLKDNDHMGYPSLYRLFMEREDILEFEFANEYLDGYEHWQILCDTAWFAPFVQRWRRELELKLRTRALVNVINESKSNSRNAFAANKFLLERGWDIEGKKNVRGRPTKDEIKAEAQAQVLDLRRINEDFKRLSGDRVN